MIFRVYALYGQSRMILGVLLLIYIGDVVVNFIASGIYSSPGSALSASLGFVSRKSE